MFIAVTDFSALRPPLILAAALVTIVLLIAKLRVHPFLALIFTAILTGVLAEKLPPGKEAHHWVRAVELTMEGFGQTAGKIGVVIALASIIGVCLVESGAADKVTRRFLALFGERRAAHALFASGYVLSIPIFFDAYFMLLLPLAKALHLRTGRRYMLFVLAICCGGTMTHSLVAPHPGPLAMAENLGLDVGQTIFCGVLAGVLPAMAAWFFSQYISERLGAPLRDAVGVGDAERAAMLAKPESELPSLAASLSPIVLPLALIGAVSGLKMFGGQEAFPKLYPLLRFLGERHVALMLGVVASLALLTRRKGITLAGINALIAGPMATAGVIILISSAGGAFGQMLSHAGVGESVKSMAGQWRLDFIFVAWAVAAIIRVAQGSATVAMMTASSIMAGLVQQGLPCHPMYIFLAVGFGSKMGSWMNDSGFWTISKLSGFTETETLKSWTALVCIESAVGLILCLTLSRLLPFAG